MRVTREYTPAVRISLFDPHISTQYLFLSNLACLAIFTSFSHEFHNWR